MLLKQIVEELECECIKGKLDIEISDIIYDSRKVLKDSVFVCMSGASFDGHTFISQAIEMGAIAVIVERDIEVREDITVIRVTSTRRALAYMSAAYFSHPARKLTMIGLTGTKGKTTTTYMVQTILEKANKKTGIIGTIGAVINGEKENTANTTPESYELQKLLRKMVEAGCEYCVMEVSSQGLKMDRVSGFTFDYGVFTNFSEDHIGPNEHASMEEYLYCKSLLFKQCKKGLINIDDNKAKGVIEGHTCEIQTYGFNEGADLMASDVEFVNNLDSLGMKFKVKGLMNKEIFTDIPGRFSVYNSLAAIMIAKNLNIDEEYILEALKDVKVRGRVERIEVPANYMIMIDYAHNAMSVQSLLTTVKEYNPKRIICIYGCGGNRSKMRRYDMGEICGKMADLSIITCDNPRDEELEEINVDIKVGLAKSNGKYVEIMDRTKAIHYAIDNAMEGDIILLLGKGHEDYQEIKGKKYYYNERRVIEDYVKVKYPKREAIN